MDVIVDFNPDKDRFEIQTPYLMNEVARSMPSRKWNKKARKWFAPCVRKNADYIEGTIARMASSTVTQRALEAIANVKTVRHNISSSALPPWYRPVMTFRNYQKTCCDQFYGMKYGALFQTMGVGKTKTAIDLMAARAMTPGKLNIDSLLVCCPFSIRSNWIKQLQEHCPIGYEAIILNHSSRTGKLSYEKLLSKTDVFRVLIVGIESLSSGGASSYVQRFVHSTKAGMVVDESSTIKNHRAKRTKTIITIGKDAAFKLILTGTPVTQSLLDLYSQFAFLDQNIIGVGDYYSFRNTYAVMGGYGNKEVIGYQNVAELLTAIKPYVNQVGEEALKELPPKTYATRTLSMTSDQNKAYNTLKNDLMIKTDSDPINVTNALEKLMRLQQITGGHSVEIVSDPLSGKLSYEPSYLSSAKADEVVAIANETAASIVVWCRFRPEIALVSKVLRKAFGADSTAEFHGGISDEYRWKAVTDFQSGKARFFVGNPTVGGMGLDLFKGSVAVFYSNSFSYSDRVQAEARIHRIGQVNPCLYVDIVVPGTVDEYVLKAIRDKKSVADFVKVALRKGTDPLSLI